MERNFRQGGTDIIFKVNGLGYEAETGDDYWAEMDITVKNRYLHYHNAGELLTLLELKILRDRLDDLINGKIKEEILIENTEPYFAFKTVPFLHKGKLDGYCVELIIDLMLGGGAGDEIYTITLYKEVTGEIKDYLDEVIPVLQKEKDIKER